MKKVFTDLLLIEAVEFLLAEIAKPIPFAGISGIPLRAADGVYYKGSNVILLLKEMAKLGQREGLPLFCGMTGWREQNRRIRKGGKASYGVVLAGYQKISKDKEGKETKEETLIPVSKLGEYQNQNCFLRPIFKSVKTFHISQTELLDCAEDRIAGLIEEYETAQAALSDIELEKFIFQARLSAEDEIEKWCAAHPKSQMLEGEKSFIALFAAEMSVAHRMKTFRPEVSRDFLGRYDEKTVEWLQKLLKNPRSLMRAMNIAYQAVYNINPELKEAEKRLEMMQRVFRSEQDTKEQAQLLAIGFESPAPVVGIPNW